VVERVLQSRKVERPAGSYTASLFERGEAQICRKIGEEATEVVTAALGGEGDGRVVSEVADLWFHSMVSSPLAASRCAGSSKSSRGATARRARHEVTRARADGLSPSRLRGRGLQRGRIESGVYYSSKAIT